MNTPTQAMHQRIAEDYPILSCVLRSADPDNPVYDHTPTLHFQIVEEIVRATADTGSDLAGYAAEVLAKLEKEIL